MNRFRIFMSGHAAGIFCTLISIVAINSIQQTIPNLGWDNSFSIAAAKNMSEGHGFSIRMARPDDISKIYYDPLNKWPPGYSVLLVGVHSMTSLGWIQSAFLLNAIGLSLLVLLFKKTLVLLDNPLWIVHVSVLYFGFVFHVFMGMYFTDILALLFFMTGCNLLLQYVKIHQKHFYLVVLAAFLFAFSAWQKYLYFGLAFIPFLSLYFFGWKRKIKIMKTSSAAGICITGLLIGLLVFFQLRNSGHAVYLKPSSSTGFFPLQLLEMAPVIPGTFLNLNFINMQIIGHTRLSYKDLCIPWAVINFLCLCLLIRICWPMIRATDYFKQESRNFYSLMSLWVMIFVFIFLGALTIHLNRHYPGVTIGWVFVGIARYFAPFCFLLFQLVVFLFQKPSIFPNKTFYNVFRILLICIVFEEVGHGIYYISKQVFIKKEYGLLKPADQRELQSALFAEAEGAKKNTVVVCAGLPESSNFSSLSGISSLMDRFVFQKPLHSSKEVLIITTLDSLAASRMPPEFFKGNTRLVEQRSGYSWYFTNIHPDIFVER